MSRYSKRVRPINDICLRYAMEYPIRQDSHYGGGRRSEIFVPPADRPVYSHGKPRIIMSGGKRVSSCGCEQNAMPGVVQAAPGDFRRER